MKRVLLLSIDSLITSSAFAGLPIKQAGSDKKIVTAVCSGSGIGEGSASYILEQSEDDSKIFEKVGIQLKSGANLSIVASDRKEDYALTIGVRQDGDDSLVSAATTSADAGVQLFRSGKNLAEMINCNLVK
ncbi:MAG: hypothetical protein AB7H97_05860 [Pseudobdellovibrionaceae bacterium]